MSDPLQEEKESAEHREDTGSNNPVRRSRWPYGLPALGTSRTLLPRYVTTPPPLCSLRPGLVWRSAHRDSRPPVRGRFEGLVHRPRWMAGWLLSPHGAALARLASNGPRSPPNSRTAPGLAGPSWSRASSDTGPLHTVRQHGAHGCHRPYRGVPLAGTPCRAEFRSARGRVLSTNA